MSDAFHRLDPGNHPTRPSAAMTAGGRSRNLDDHQEAAAHFQPSDELIDAVNIALAVEAPLLLTGEPGTGKTQVAFYVAHYFGIPDRLHRLYVRSTTRAEDLLYRFDEVAYFHAAQDPGRRGEKIDRSEFVEPGPLWRAYSEGPAMSSSTRSTRRPATFPTTC